MKNKFLIRTCGIFLRYALFQLPDLLILILILLISRHFLKISEFALFVIIGFWILKDIALYPFVGRYYDPDYQKDRFSLVGKKGTVKKPLKPKGKILIKGELWKA